MSRSRQGLVLSGLALAGLTLACSTGEPLPGGSGGPPDPPVYGASDAPFLSLVPDAPFVNAFRGVRHVELNYGPDPVVYREDVGSDGLGKFFVEPLEILSPHPDPDVFESLLAMRQVYLYRERDWRITDYDLFHQNFGVSVIDNDVQVAGIDCVRIMVSRILTSPTHYFVDVDPLTGVVLSWEERGDQNALLARVEFETFEYDGDLGGMPLTDRVFPNTTSHAIDGDLEAVFGFEPVIPTLMPAPGVVLSPQVERIVDSTGAVWAKVTMTDGLETAMVLSSTPTGTPKVQPSTVMAIQLGSWAGMEGSVSGQPVRFAGKFPLPLLQLTLESAF